MNRQPGPIPLDRTRLQGTARRVTKAIVGAGLPGLWWPPVRCDGSGPGTEFVPICDSGVTAGVPVGATDAEVRQFRSNLARERLLRDGRLLDIASRVFALPLALRQAWKGIRKYGRAVRARDGVSEARQFRYLLSDYFLRIRPDDFYAFELHRTVNRQQRARHFAFSQVLALQKFLIDHGDSPDYPRLTSKARFAAICADLGLPAVPVLAEFVDGTTEPHHPALPAVDLFAKPSDRMLGLGTALWRYQGAGDYVAAASGDRRDADGLCRRLTEQSRIVPAYGGSGGIVLQERLWNHRAMLGTLTTGGLATIRLVSCRSVSGAFELLPPVIRMPVGDAIADNIAQGGLAAPIDGASGRISGPAIRKDKAVGISVYAAHPTTGARLDGFAVPFWSKVPALALRAHRAFPSLAFIGWDIAVLDDGPVLLEGNAWWDVDLTVLPHRMTLSDTRFVALCNEHFAALRKSA